MCIYNFDEDLNFLDLKRKPLFWGPKSSHLGGESGACRERSGRRNTDQCTLDLLLRNQKLVHLAKGWGLATNRGNRWGHRRSLPDPAHCFTDLGLCLKRLCNDLKDTSSLLGEPPMFVRAGTGPDPLAFIEHLLYIGHLHRCPLITSPRTPGSRWVYPYVPDEENRGSGRFCCLSGATELKRARFKSQVLQFTAMPP